MIHETTLYINNKVKEEIKKAAEQSGKSECFLIKEILKKVIFISKNSEIRNRLTSYQDKNNQQYEHFRYRLNDDEHKEFNNARQRLNISISKLLFIGFILFFKKIIKKYLKKCSEKKWYNYTTINSLYKYLVIDFCKEINYHGKKEP